MTENEGSLTMLYKSYQKSTDNIDKIIDKYLALNVSMGVLQFLYALLFVRKLTNPFLAGFITNVALFVFGVNYRMKKNFSELVFCSLAALYFAMNLLG